MDVKDIPAGGASRAVAGRRILASADDSCGVHDVLRIYERDSAGFRTEELHYGGDQQPLSTGDLCVLAPPEAPAYYLSYLHQFGAPRKTWYVDSADSTLVHTLDLDLDPSTGLALVSRDDAGLATAYSYDNLGRLTNTKPAAGHDGATQIL